MAEQCPICRRPKLGHQQGDQRPCHQPGGQVCYQLGYSRVSEQLALAKLRLTELGEKVDQALELAPEEGGELGKA